jgi:hypothetical protein
MRRFSPASRSFVLAALRALHLDTGCETTQPRSNRPNGPETTKTDPTLFTGGPITDKSGQGRSRRQRGPGGSAQTSPTCRMADVHWADRYAVDGMFIREVLLGGRDEVTDECARDRRISRMSAARRRVRRRLICAPGEAGLRAGRTHRRCADRRATRLPARHAVGRRHRARRIRGRALCAFVCYADWWARAGVVAATLPSVTSRSTDARPQASSK